MAEKSLFDTSDIDRWIGVPIGGGEIIEDAVKAIAYSLGFASPSAFACAFRRATGETPREFRQRVSRAD